MRACIHPEDLIIHEQNNLVIIQGVLCWSYSGSRENAGSWFVEEEISIHTHLIFGRMTT